MQKKAKMSLEKRHNLTGWAFLIPAALLIFIFCFYPMVQALILSFSKKGTGGSAFVGLANYQRILRIRHSSSVCSIPFFILSFRFR